MAPRSSSGAFGAKQIATGAVGSAEVKDHSLLAKDFKPGQLPAGAQGAQGAPGSQGSQGAKGDRGDKGDKGDAGTPATRLVGSRVGRGGGSTIPTPVVAVDTGFYAGSSMTVNQVRVSTYLSGARQRLDFDIAAFC
jgi:hypothetical protein